MIVKKELVSIDNRYEKAVNLSLDLHNKKKIENYIPTTSSVRVLDSFFDNVIGNSDKRANILVGPYGRGKSHLLLVLLTILSGKESKELTHLKQRIISSFPEIDKKINRFEETGPFLPVIINPSDESLNKTFFKGLAKALQENNLSDISPDNFFTEALKTIKLWKKDYPKTYESFLLEIDTEESIFISNLKKYDEKTLQVFRTIYPKLTSGSAFNPLVDDDIISVYKTVNRKLRTQKSFGGIYIVFDEFSKFIEGHNQETFASDMKTLQDLFELSLASKEEQLHITCVAHKSISNYNRTISNELVNAFEGVAGRLSEIPFVFSSKNNYELIADAITKKGAFSKFALDNKEYNSIANASYNLKIFNSLFNEDDYLNYVARGCYPLTPVTAMLLLELCERIAQNERTVFTFLSSSDHSSLSKVIEIASESTFVGVDTVYDYFEQLFKKDSSFVHFEWLKSEYAISKCSNENQIRIIKAIAIIRMVSKEELIVNDILLRLALGLDNELVDKELQDLINEGVITYKRRIQAYDFASNVGVDIESTIKDTIQKHYLKTDICEILTNINKQKNILPKKHNQKYCITRYFNVIFINEDSLLALKNLNYVEGNYYPDGFVFFVIGREKKETIIAHLKTIENDNFVVVFPNSDEDISEKTKGLLAIRKLGNTQSFTEDNPILIQELFDLEDELVEDINDWIQHNYFASKEVFDKSGVNVDVEQGLNRVISNVCDNTYNKSLIVNHELINRHMVSSQISKARANIIRMILADESMAEYESGTSAESTIYRAVLCSNSNKDVESIINSFFINSVGKKTAFNELIDVLTAPPYGIRRGILPLLIAHEICKRNGTPVIYLKEKEVVLNEESLVNIIRKPNDYYLYIEEASATKDKYIDDIKNLFSEYEVYCNDTTGKNKLSKTVCLIQTWYRSLPQTSISFIEADYKNQNINLIISFRNIFKDFYLNPRDVLFEAIPKALGTTSFEETFEAVKLVKHDIDNHVIILKSLVVKLMRNAFGFKDSEDITRALEDWYSRLPDDTKKYVYGGDVGVFMSVFANTIPNDPEQIASVFAKTITGVYIEDWSENTIIQFNEKLSSVIEELLSRSNKPEGGNRILISNNGEVIDCMVDYNPEELSVSGVFLKNALMDALDEYGDVIDNNEKLGIIMELASKIIN